MSDLTDDQFHAALSAEDHLGMVVRAHIHVEHWAERFLNAAMPFYENYEKQLDLDYETKILLCCTMGLTPTLKSPLNAVGKLRNRFAHEPNFELSDAVVTNLYETLSSKHKEELQLTYSKLAKKFARKEKQYSFLPPELKLSLIFMFLRVKLRKAISQLQQVT